MPGQLRRAFHKRYNGMCCGLSVHMRRVLVGRTEARWEAPSRGSHSRRSSTAQRRTFRVLLWSAWSGELGVVLGQAGGASGPLLGGGDRPKIDGETQKGPEGAQGGSARATGQR